MLSQSVALPVALAASLASSVAAFQSPNLHDHSVRAHHHGKEHARMARDYAAIHAAFDRRMNKPGKGRMQRKVRRGDGKSFISRAPVTSHTPRCAALLATAGNSTDATAASSSTYSSTAIWWLQDGWTGSCGTSISASAMQVALPLSVYPDASVKSALCGTTVTVTASTGKSIDCVVVGASERNDYTTFTQDAFTALEGDLQTGELAITFSLSGGAPAPVAASSSSAAAPATSSAPSSSSALSKEAKMTTTTTTTTTTQASTTQAVKATGKAANLNLAQHNTPAPTTTTTSAAAAATSSDGSADDWVCDNDGDETASASAAAPSASSSSSSDGSGDDWVCDDDGDESNTAAAATPSRRPTAKSSNYSSWSSSSNGGSDASSSSSSSSSEWTAPSSTTTSSAPAQTSSSSSSGSSSSGSSSSSSGVADTSGSLSLLSKAGIQGFLGDNTNAILSWYHTDSSTDSTNGHSWCGFPYNDAVPGFAPSLKTMLNNFGGDYQKAATAYCGLEAVVTTPDGKSETLYIADAFDDTWVRTPASLDIIYGSFSKLFGSTTNNKNDVVQGASWKLTGNRNDKYKFKSTTSLS
ncbi:hypothetical protein JCM8202_002684 [Rhodotorula sphaerocarpa]